MVCVPCAKIYRAHRNGVYLQEGMPGSNGHPPDEKTGWCPYKLWVGDLLKCPGCGHEVIAGIPMHPVIEHFEAEYAKFVAQLQPILFVADCGPLQLGAPRLTKENSFKQDRAKAANKITDAVTDIENLVAEIRDNSALLLEDE